MPDKLRIHFLSQNRTAKMGMGWYERLLLEHLLNDQDSLATGIQGRITFDGRAPKKSLTASGSDSKFVEMNFLGFSTSKLARAPWALVKPLMTLLLPKDASLYHSLALSFPAPMNVPSIYTIHDLPPAHFSDEGFLPGWSKSAANEAEAIVTPSEFGKREIIEQLHVNPQRVHVIPNGCEHELFNTKVVPMTASELASEGVPANFLFYAGGSTRRKNVSALLEAWTLISSDYPDLHLVLAGPTEGLKSLTVTSGAPRVVVLGYVEHQLMPRIMKAAKAFVFPSIYEGFGLPPMEAMALGVPTIGSLAGGAVPEVIGDSGILAEDGSAIALAEAIKRLLNDPQLSEQLQQSGPERVRNLPSWAQHAQSVVSVYKSILS